MKLIKKHLSVAMTMIIVFALLLPVQAMAASVGGSSITSQGACAMDFETGLLLYGHNERTQRVPASMTKLLAAYVVYDAIGEGVINLNSQTQISRGVSELSYNWEYSNVPLPEGITVTIEELLEVVLVWSACAATVALGEAIYGSEEALVTRMNDRVASLDINAVFYDSYGVSARNSISPLGMAHLTRNLILDHPEILTITSKRSITFRGTEYINTNRLLGEYSGIDGIKTGYTDAAGYCFTGTAQRDGRRIIIVTMGSTQASRFQDTRILLDYGFEVADDVISEHNTIMASPSNAFLILNNVPTPLSAYLIDDSHYFMLRDIATLLDGTQKQFNVTWDPVERVVHISTGVGYADSDGNLSNPGIEPQPCMRTPSGIMLDGVEFELEVYLINDSNYFKLRDIGDLIGFDVGWVPEIRTILISTFTGCVA